MISEVATRWLSAARAAYVAKWHNAAACRRRVCATAPGMPWPPVSRAVGLAAGGGQAASRSTVSGGSCSRCLQRFLDGANSSRRFVDAVAALISGLTITW